MSITGRPHYPTLKPLWTTVYACDSKQSMPERKAKRTAVRSKRIASMAKEILDVAGAAELLGVSPWTIYQLARKGTIPGTRVGKEWRFARQVLIQWVANGSQADQVSKLLSRSRSAQRR